jgi:hypothetical protein
MKYRVILIQNESEGDIVTYVTEMGGRIQVVRSNMTITVGDANVYLFGQRSRPHQMLTASHRADFKPRLRANACIWALATGKYMTLLKMHFDRPNCVQSMSSWLDLPLTEGKRLIARVSLGVV